MTITKVIFCIRVNGDHHFCHSSYTCDDCIISLTRDQPIGRKHLKIMFKKALGRKFNKLKTPLVAYVIGSESIFRHDVERWIEQKGDLTTHSYDDDYVNLITIIVEVHMIFHLKFYVPCDRNEYANNAKKSDVAEVVLPSLVPNRYLGRNNAVTDSCNQGNSVTAF